MKADLHYELTAEYETDANAIDLRNAWNKQNYGLASPVMEFPIYIQVFSDRHPFAADLSILDLIFCLGPRSLDYLNDLQLRPYER